MRLFIAIALPDEVVSELARLQKELGMPGLRPAQEFHLTLKFLGEVPETRLEKIRMALRGIRFSPFEGYLSEIGVFPNPNSVRVIWVGVRSDMAGNLQKEIDLSLEQLGFPREKDYKPHLTLHRVSFIKDKQALGSRLAAAKVNPLRFIVEDFRLIESKLTPSGPIYKTIEIFRCSQ